MGPERTAAGRKNGLWQRAVLQVSPWVICLGSTWAAGCAGHTQEGEACDLVAGDLVVSEIMANPLGDDSGGEWLEIYNASSEAKVLDRVVLRRLWLASDGSEKHGDHALRGAGSIPAHAYYVLGDGEVGNAPIDYSYRGAGDSLGALNNDVGGLSLRCLDREIDTVWYGTDGGAPSPTNLEGSSLSFDGSVAPDGLLNDRGELWCIGQEVYAQGNRGTPRQANTACGLAKCEANGDWRDVVVPTAGDLVVTEVFADPKGADAGKEWLEVWVAAPHAVDLNGLQIVNVNLSGQSQRSFSFDSAQCLEAVAGEHIVVGAASDQAANGGVMGVDFVVADLAMFNGGTVELRRGPVVMDVAAYPELAMEGTAAVLDPEQQTVAGNDTPSAFCLARTCNVFAGCGTPGLVNDPCGPKCREGDAVRFWAWPQAGDLVITEVYANPPGADGERDWLEVYVAAATALDLNGLTIENVNATPSSNSWSLDMGACVSVAPGTYAVVGGSRVADDNVVAAMPLVGSDTLFYASVSRLALKAGDALVDQAYYTPKEGKSWTLDNHGLPSATLNDDAQYWCDAPASHLPFTGIGSPGTANDVCP